MPKSQHEPRSILAVRHGPIGNTLAAVPALRAIRRRYPAARLALVLSPSTRPLFEACPWVDDLMTYDPRGREGTVAGYLALVRRIRSLQPTHALLFKRFLRAAVLGRLSGAAVRLGFRTGDRAPFLTRTVDYNDDLPIVDLNLQLALALDAPAAGRQLEAFPGAEARARAAQALVDLGAHPGDFWVAHYGGTTTPPVFVTPARFAALLTRAAGAAPVLLTGSGERERLWAGQVRASLADARLALDLPVDTTAALMHHARGFVGFSSGPAHLAAAAGIPLWIVFRPGHDADREVRKWLPPSEHAHAVLPPAVDSDPAWAEVYAQVFPR